MKSSLLLLLAADAAEALAGGALRARNESSTTTSYIRYQRENGLWAISVNQDRRGPEQDCLARCTWQASCACTGWDSSHGACWMRPSCEFHEAGDHAVVFAKVLTPWVLAGAALQRNRLQPADLANASGGAIAAATSREPVTGISLRAVSTAKISLSTSPVPNGDIGEEGISLEHLGNGSWMIHGGSSRGPWQGSTASLRINWPTRPTPMVCSADAWQGAKQKCDDCKVLVDSSMSDHHRHTCSGYCESVGRECAGAFQSKGQTCQEESALTCDVFLFSNMICHCGGELQRVIAAFDGHEVVLGQANQKAMYAQIVLTGPNSSVDVQEVSPLPFFGKVITTTYRELVDKNAYGADAKPIGKHSRHNVTAEQCQKACTEVQECDCVTWGRGGPFLEDLPENVHRCWLRAECYPHGVVNSTYDAGYNVYMKQEVQWQLAGATLVGNTFSKSLSQPGSAQVVSTSPVTSVTVAASPPAILGLVSSAEPGTALVGDFCISFSDGHLQTSCRHSANGTVTLSVMGGEVVATVLGQELKLGAATASLYAKLVLLDSGSFMEVRGAVLAEPPQEAGVHSYGTHWLRYGLPIIGFFLVACSIAAVVCKGYLRGREEKDGMYEADDVESGGQESPPSGSTRLAEMASLSDEEKARDPAWAAISLDQLNDLRELARESLGAGYSSATMYDINRVVLQPLCTAQMKSYAHFVNSSQGSKLLHLTVFVSHAWAENFDMFVESINNEFQSWAVKPNLWICATALLQTTDPNIIAMQVGTGADPSTAPFTKALAQAEKLLIVRNDAVDLYDRIWCCWELFVAYEQGLVKRPGCLMVVGPPAAEGLPVDITMAKASNEEDKRKILVHVLSGQRYQAINRALTEIKYYGGSA